MLAVLGRAMAAAPRDLRVSFTTLQANPAALLWSTWLTRNRELEYRSIERWREIFLLHNEKMRWQNSQGWPIFWANFKAVIERTLVTGSALPKARVPPNEPRAQVNKPRCRDTAPRWHCDGHLSQPARYAGGGQCGGQGLARPLQVNTLWMLSDFTVENGGTWVVPGRRDPPSHAQPQPALPVF